MTDATLAQSNAKTGPDDIEDLRAQLHLEQDAQGKRAMLGGYQMPDALIPSLEAQSDAEPELTREALKALVIDCENKWGDPHTLAEARAALAQSDAEPGLIEAAEMAHALLKKWNAGTYARKAFLVLDEALRARAAERIGKP